MSAPTTYSVQQVAEVLQCSEAHVWALLSRGALKSFKTGKLRRISQRALDSYIASQEAAEDTRRLRLVTPRPYRRRAG